MDPVAVQREVELVEADLARSRAHLADEAWLERTSATVVKEERARLKALGERQSELREALGLQEPLVSGELSSPYVGRWEPLPLFDDGGAAAPRGGSDDGPTWPEAETSPASPVEPPLETDQRETFSRRIAEACRWRARPADVLAALRTVRKACGRDLPTLRLLAAALTGTHPKLEGQVRAQLRSLGVAGPASPKAWDSKLPLTRGLSESAELPDLEDGLTRTQRLVVSVMRKLAPASGPLVPAAAVVAEVTELDEAPASREVERALVQLCHPLLRRCPLVEFRGLTRRRTPGEARVESVRLVDFAEAYLEGSLALPLLLINGAEGPGTLFPGHGPGEVLEGAVALLSFGQADVRSHVLGPDFPTGGVLHDRGRWGLRCSGSATLRLRAALEVQARADSVQGRLLITELPLPLRPPDVLRGLGELQAAGALEGVTEMYDESTSEGTELVVELEHLAFANSVLRALEQSQLVEVALPAEYRVQSQGVVSVLTLQAMVERFLHHRRERVRQRLMSELESAGRRAALAEAMVVALELLEPVLAALRATYDDEEGVRALMGFLRPEHRAALPQGLPQGLSHGYERGFTEAQARHLVKQHRLASRSRVFAHHEWTALLKERREAERALGSDAEVTRRLRAELLEAQARFSEPRRTRIARWA